MPDGEVDEDFEENAGAKRKSKSKKKKESETDIDLAKKKADSLFHKFGLAEKLLEIEEAERKEDFEKII